MKYLEINDNYEEVKCPRCGYAWWSDKNNALPWHDPIRCPQCCAPLKSPDWEEILKEYLPPQQQTKKEGKA